MMLLLKSKKIHIHFNWEYNQVYFLSCYYIYWTFHDGFFQVLSKTNTLLVYSTAVKDLQIYIPLFFLESLYVCVSHWGYSIKVFNPQQLPLNQTSQSTQQIFILLLNFCFGNLFINQYTFWSSIFFTYPLIK
jgi:hypothetical protein